MNSPEKIQEAARIIYECRRDRTTIPRLPEDVRPEDPETALAIQDEVTRLLNRWPTGAWKTSMPRPGRIGVAPVLDVYAKSPVPVISNDRTKLIESEIVFVLAHDLPPRSTPYSDEEIRASIGEARLAIEVLGPRLSDIGETSFPEKMADHVMNESLFVGPLMTAPIDAALASFPVTIDGPDGRLHTIDGKHPDGGPFGPFAFLVNHLSSRGKGLRVGDIVTTGSYIGFISVPVGVPLQFTYGALGSFGIELAKA